MIYISNDIISINGGLVMKDKQIEELIKAEKKAPNGRPGADS